MIIIVEGIDNMGKSTFIKTLEKQNKDFDKVMIWKNMFKPTTDNYSERQKVKTIYSTAANIFTDPFFKKNKVLIITDRNFPSERVYSYKRDYEAMYDKELDEVEKKLVDKALYVWLNTGKDFFMSNMERRGDDYITPEEYGVLHNRYRQVFGDISLDKIEVNSLDFEKEVESVLTKAFNLHKVGR